MKFGTRLYGCDPEAVVVKAQRAEALGFDSVWRGDHLLLPSPIPASYPHSADGRPPLEPASPILDVLVLYAYVARATQRIQLATGIYLLALREPVGVARAVLTLDVVSGGRAVLGVATGWLREEFAFVGQDFESRGRRTNDAIQLLRALWTEERPVVGGNPVHFEPKPVRRPHPPIVGGGESPAALLRAAMLCDGWYGHRPTPEVAAERVATLRALRADGERAGEPFEVTVRVMPDEVSRDLVARYEEAGVDRLVAEIGAFDDVAAREDIDAMERFAERVGLP